MVLWDEGHIRADADSGLVRTVPTTPANESDVAQVDCLRHGKETVEHADKNYTGAPEYAPRTEVEWQIARKRGLVKKIADTRARTKAAREERGHAQNRACV